MEHRSNNWTNRHNPALNTDVSRARLRSRSRSPVTWFVLVVTRKSRGLVSVSATRGAHCDDD